MTIFSKIIAGDIPSYKIAESEKFFAFLDIFPIKKGHTLVIPKIEVDKIFDVPDEFLSELLVFAKPIARAIEKCFPCDRVNIITVGLEVPHAHVHLIPINRPQDMHFDNPKLKLSKEEFVKIQQQIIAEMEKAVSKW
ncbi:MAG: family hydrolase [Segetibacter sp.]|nr:family hydrolase [Segetibacter sp.]